MPHSFFCARFRAVGHRTWRAHRARLCLWAVGVVEPAADAELGRAVAISSHDPPKWRYLWEQRPSVPLDPLVSIVALIQTIRGSCGHPRNAKDRGSNSLLTFLAL